MRRQRRGTLARTVSTEVPFATEAGLNSVDMLARALPRVQCCKSRPPHC